MTVQLPINWPAPMLPFWTERRRFKVAYGGRGGGKSWTIAEMLVLKALYEKNHLILCTREFQTSIADSVHKTLVSKIQALGLARWFRITDNSIRCPSSGSEFIFKGLRRNINEIKSTEGVTICWVEEAQAVSEHSWTILIPTIRAAGSEIWISFNPMEDDDPTYKRFVLQPPPNALVVSINWRDNPWFPEELDQDRRHMLQVDPDAYDWVWNGNTRHVSEATIFRGRFVVEPFETPTHDIRFLFGADWGFSTDPSVLMRCWRKQLPDGRFDLMIDQEAYGLKVELDDLEHMFAGGKSVHSERAWEGIEGAKSWPIKADSSRPETISFVRRLGFNISPATKWQNSVEDGVEYLKTYRRIVIHPRCVHMAQEARLYSYKVDSRTGDILPVIEDKHNHCWDAIRYAHDGYITATGALGAWQKLAKKV